MKRYSLKQDLRRRYRWLLLLPVLAFGLSLSPWAASGSVLYAQAAPEEKPLRLHVLANSDGIADQELKLAVRDLLILSLEDGFSSLDNKEQAMAYVEERLPELTETVNAFLQANGATYQAQLRLERADFPEITYDGVAFAAGEYDALRVLLGQAAGHNWWCVLFPPLCFVDVAGAYQTDAAAVLAMAGEEAAAGEAGIQIRFKLAELWQGLTQ